MVWTIQSKRWTVRPRPACTGSTVRTINKQPQKTLFCFLFLIPFSSCSPSLTTSLCANVCVQRRTAAGHTRWSINDNLTRLRRPLRSSSENCLLPPSGEVGHLRWWLLTRNESWTVWIGPKIVCASTDIAFSRRKWKKKKKSLSEFREAQTCFRTEATFYKKTVLNNHLCLIWFFHTKHKVHRSVEE